MSALPDCANCGHEYLAHSTSHRDGCLGMPDRVCGPDCRDECMGDGCSCSVYVPGRRRLSSGAAGGTKR